MLQVVFPGADVLITILIDHCSLPTLKPLLKVACILTSIFECDLALALKHIFSKVPLVGLFRLSKVVGAVAAELAVVEVAFVERAIDPLVATSALLLSLDVLATELDLAELPSLFAKAVL